jgi:4-hydroxy-4-methyl-2-oxoglutarate aldolase
MTHSPHPLGNATAEEDAVAAALVSRYLDPRMTTEHVYSGGGACVHSSIRPLIAGLRFAGRALTVRTQAGFTRRPLEALAIAKPGDVLVINAGGDSEVAPWGGVVHWNAARKGLAGVVVDGPTRDLVEMKAMTPPLPIFARAQVAGLAGFGTPSSGAIGEQIICGGVVVCTGDLVFGDDDGVAVVPWERAEAVLDLAIKNMAFDLKEMAWVESGRSVYELLTKLWDPDGVTYKERKFRWATSPKLDDFS